MTFPLPGANWAYTHSMRRIATTGLTGYTLVNGTGNVISAAVPADGKLHPVLISGICVVSSAETGGTIALAATTPDGGQHTFTLWGAGLGSGAQPLSNPAYQGIPVAPGSTVTIEQYSALTAGAAVLYAELWAG